MNKVFAALALAALMAVAVNPAFAHCGGSHGKSYRAAKASGKPAAAKAAQPSTPAATTTGLDTSSGFDQAASG